MSPLEVLAIPSKFHDQAQSDSRLATDEGKRSRLNDLAVDAFDWVVNTRQMYSPALNALPSCFQWTDSSPLHASIGNLAESVALSRLRAGFDHIARRAPALYSAMRDTLEGLPASGISRFMTAPETVHRIATLRWYPSESIMWLCRFLNGEAALNGLGDPREDYCTALGDVYWATSEEFLVNIQGSDPRSSKLYAVVAPKVGGMIPIDFSSPNVANVKSPGNPDPALPYSFEEKQALSKRIDEALQRIASVSEPAARLILQYVKVIIPIKKPLGFGSISVNAIPGRVSLQGPENMEISDIDSALVHEAIHQIMYQLENAGRFIQADLKQISKPTARSPWTGRDLSLSSFIHACFVWYGLANYWAMALNTNAYDRAGVERHLNKSTRGFQDSNPVDLLEPFRGQIRPDTLRVGASLREKVLSLIDLTADA